MTRRRLRQIACSMELHLERVLDGLREIDNAAEEGDDLAGRAAEPMRENLGAASTSFSAIAEDAIAEMRNTNRA